MSVRILSITGDTPRHLYVHAPFVDNSSVVGAVLMERESMRPNPPESIAAVDRENFIRHFDERHTVEHRTFGEVEGHELFHGLPTLAVDRKGLNSERTAAFIEELMPDIVLITGAGMIESWLIDQLPEYTLNVHLGLSPWYRGAAGLFWPFYNLEPACAGATIHHIDALADTGPIVHQSVPELRPNDGVHDVAARTVVTVRNDLVRLVDKFGHAGSLRSEAQKPYGRYYLTKTFRPEHLRVIYDLFDNKIVDSYLKGDLAPKRPKLLQPNF